MTAPLASAPMVLKALAVALLVASSVQAWQLYQWNAAPASLGAPRAADAPSAPSNNTTAGLDHLGPGVNLPNGSVANATPGPVLRIDPPKYRLDADFTWESRVSSTPVVASPWTGNGPPHVIVYYRGLADTGILHNAYLALVDYKGFDVCDGDIIRYWEWQHVPATPATSTLAFTSMPVPENPYNLLGAGENCYGRAYAGSEWVAEVCMEGDGRIAAPWTEDDPDNGTVIQHVDFMDYCLAQGIKIAA